MIHNIEYDGKLLAIIIKADFSSPGIHFFTPDAFSQQLAYMKHNRGKIIEPHVHRPVSREVMFTQEVLFIKKGVLRVDFYDRHETYVESHILRAGDTILLASGGHGFEVLEDLEMIEVKQGPYTGDEDKARFSGVKSDSLQVKEEKNE